MWQLISLPTLLADNKLISSVNEVSKSTLQLPKETLITRHSPKLNGGGRVEGSIRVLLAESFDVNGNATVTGDIYVPGSPEIQINSSVYKGTVIGDGNQYPSNNYIIKLRGSSTVNRIVTRTDAVKISPVPTVTQTQGTRDVFLIKGDKPGDFSTIRDLVLTRKYNLMLEIPEGSYGIFRAHGRSGFILGVDNQETTYNLQSLELNSDTRLEIRGKVTINIKNGLTLNSEAKMGYSNNPRSLFVNLESGEAKLNSNTEFYGVLNAPLGMVTLNSNSRLVGLVICDRANLNSNSVLSIISSSN